MNEQDVGIVARHRRGDREARRGAASAVTRVPRGVAEEGGRERDGGAADSREGGGHAETGEVMRRAEAVPAVHAAGSKGLRGSAAVGGLAVPPAARPRGRARDPAVLGRD